MKKTICLNMIVKDESHVIERCLASVKPLIDYWVIVDTGSTDGTQEIIREFLKDIPGELHERPWVNFGHNRNEALSLARGKGKYFLFMDADDVLSFSKNFQMPVLDKPFYILQQQDNQPGIGPLNIYKPMLVKDLPNFHWEGAVHEHIPIDPSLKGEFLPGAVCLYIHDGNRSKDPHAISRDIQMLEEELARDPNNRRDVFFLAQTHARAKNYEQAIASYKKRAEMGGFEEEVFWSLYMIGEIQEFLGRPSKIVIESYCKAYQYRPTRAEPLFRLASYFFYKQKYVLGYAIANIGDSIPLPKDQLFVKEEVYKHGFKKLLKDYAEYMSKHDRQRRKPRD